MTEGVITGCNENHEWLLKTWWHYYTKSNSYPVTFMDFGMSKSARIWCEKRAPVISIPLPKTASKEEVDPQKAKIWETVYNNPWPGRPLWARHPRGWPWPCQAPSGYVLRRPPAGAWLAWRRRPPCGPSPRDPGGSDGRRRLLALPVCPASRGYRDLHPGSPRASLSCLAYTQ